jgi:hypothetical protein
VKGVKGEFIKGEEVGCEVTSLSREFQGKNG